MRVGHLQLTLQHYYIIEIVVLKQQLFMIYGPY